MRWTGPGAAFDGLLDSVRGRDMLLRPARCCPWRASLSRRAASRRGTVRVLRAPPGLQPGRSTLRGSGVGAGWTGGTGRLGVSTTGLDKSWTPQRTPRLSNRRGWTGARGGGTAIRQRWVVSNASAAATRDLTVGQLNVGAGGARPQGRPGCRGGVEVAMGGLTPMIAASHWYASPQVDGPSGVSRTADRLSWAAIGQGWTCIGHGEPSIGRGWIVIGHGWAGAGRGATRLGRTVGQRGSGRPGTFCEYGVCSDVECVVFRETSARCSVI